MEWLKLKLQSWNFSSDWSWSWSSNTLVTWCEEPTLWKRPRCWEILRAGGEEGDRGWEGRMASSTQWTWVWANSWRWWRTGKQSMGSGILQSMGSQRVGHDWVAKQQQDDTTFIDKSLSGSRPWGHWYDLAPVTSYFLPQALCTAVLQAHCFPPENQALFWPGHSQLLRIL